MVPTACLVFAIVVASLLNAHASDPDILSDFLVPNGTTVDANSFTFRGFRGSLWGAAKGTSLKINRASQVEFPILTGLGISCNLLQYGPGGLNPPHTHPRSTELTIVIQGCLEVGFVDSNNKLFSQVLYPGDMFVYPKGLVHFQNNKDSKRPTVSLNIFGSSNPGAVSLPLALFGSGIDTDILAKSFNTDTKTIENLLVTTTQG